MEGSCSTGQSPQWAVVPVEEEDVVHRHYYTVQSQWTFHITAHVTG
jgi:hypothetical protein